MAKNNVFKLVKHYPFIVEGEHGNYEIPHPQKLDLDIVEPLVDMVEGKSMKERSKISKEFFLQVCPDLEKEEISDYDWLSLMNMYDAYGAGE